MRGNPRRGRLAAVVALALVSLASCGKRGDPLPPLRRIPQPVTGLRLAQRGDKLEVAYTAPRATTEGGRLPVLEIELLRMDGEGAFPKGARRTTRKAAPGETLLEVAPLPAPGTPVRVSARALAKGKASGLPPPLTLTVKTPPPPPTALKAALVPRGVALTWEGVLPPAPPEPLASSPAATPAAKDDPGTKAPAAPPAPGSTPAPPPTPAGTTPIPGASPASKPAPAPPPAPTFRPGFWVYRRAPESVYARPLFTVPVVAFAFDDTTAEPGESWCYVVRTALSVDPVIESVGSDEACLEVKDVNAPAAPVGLTALPRDGAVELSWSPSSEADLKAYRVYRAGPGARERIAEVPAGETTYLDKTGVSGTPYRYTVTALDAAGNESPPSSPSDTRAP